MKINCRKHGLHFENEFEDTLQEDCTMWGELDLEMLSPEDKKKYFEWYMSNPCDWLLEKYDTTIELSVRHIRNVSCKMKLLKEYDDYKDLSDKEKRDYQRKIVLGK